MAKSIPTYQAIARMLAAYVNCEDSDNTAWRDKHAEAIERLMRETAPHGSGFNKGTALDFEKSTPDRLIFTTAFQHMDEMGGYDGWTNHAVKVMPSLVSGYTLQITGRNKNNIKDYIHETFDNWLDSEIESNQFYKEVSHV